MPHFWLGLALFVLLPTIGAVVLVRRGLALWRDLRRGGKALFEGLDGLGRRLERTSAAGASLGEVPGRAEPGVARLQLSLARLAVLRSAVRDIQDSVGRVTAIYPRK